MQAQTVTHADTVSNTFDLSTAEKARVDMPYMAELTGKTMVWLTKIRLIVMSYRGRLTVVL